MSRTDSAMRLSVAGGAQKDYRRLAAVALLATILLLGYLVSLLPGRGIEASTQDVPNGRAAFAGLEATTASRTPGAETEAVQKPQAQDGELGRALKQSESLIAAEKYDEAIAAINGVRPLAGNSAQAYRQLGRALLGKKDYATARDFLAKAIDLDPTLAEAYFDHATASEGLGELEAALGGMRSFLHLVKDADPYRLPVAQARSAIWEWEAKLGRGVYGPTKGVPPGFTAEQIKRDGKGVGIMMQKPETLRPDGSMDYEIKSGERFPNLWKK